jgi:hypothetical protein
MWAAVGMQTFDDGLVERDAALRLGFLGLMDQPWYKRLVMLVGFDNIQRDFLDTRLRSAVLNPHCATNTEG